MPTVERPDPPYLQIVRQIRGQIDSGELRPGDAVPSARMIGEEWGVAHATAARVITVLRNDGLIVTSARGSFVAEPLSGTQAYARSVKARGKIYPQGHHAVIVSVEVITAPDHIVGIMGVNSVIRRERVTWAPDKETGEDRPYSTSVSWFDGAVAEVCPMLFTGERILHGTAQYVADQTGRGRSPHERNIVAAHRASEREAERLNIQRGDPVLRGRAYFWDLHGGVLEYGESSKREEIEESYDYTVESETST